MDSPDKLATLGTQDITKRNKTNNMTQKQRRCATRTPQKPRRELRHLERASSRVSHITADM